jgi:hypothetical protein
MLMGAACTLSKDRFGRLRLSTGFSTAVEKSSGARRESMDSTMHEQVFHSQLWISYHQQNRREQTFLTAQRVLRRFSKLSTTHFEIEAARISAPAENPRSSHTLSTD